MSNAAIRKELKVLDGGTIVATRVTEDGTPCLLVRLVNGALVWVDGLCDPEGNGPGYLSILIAGLKEAK
jgi:hypothetical protein